MKKIIVLTAMMLAVVAAWAYDVKIDNIYYDLTEKTKVAVVVKGDGSYWYSGMISIPSTVEYEGIVYNVTTIGVRAFENCAGLTYVNTGEGVSTISYYAFSGCSGLKNVVLGSSVSTIGANAFDGCNAIEYMTFKGAPDKMSGQSAISQGFKIKKLYLPSVEVWCDAGFVNWGNFPYQAYADSVFFDGKCVTDLSIPNTVSSINEGAFSHMKHFETITIPNSVEKIGSGAFYNCRNVKSVSLPDSLMEIPSEVFANCVSLASIVIPESVISIGSAAFSTCTSLDGISIPDNVRMIGSGAFSGCTGFRGFSFPDNITEVPGYVLNGCTGLTSVRLNPMTCSVGASAFRNCKSLQSIDLPVSVEYIGAEAFMGSGLVGFTFPEAVKEIEDGVLSGCGQLKDVKLSSSISSIGEKAFYECKSIKVLSLPKSVSQIGMYAFAECKNIMDVYCFMETVPRIDSYTFYNSLIEYATLHVPEKSLNKYSSASIWKNFGKIVLLTADDAELEPVPTPVCATPTIRFENGHIAFYCDTEGVRFVGEVNSDDFKKTYTDVVELSATYSIQVYASKAGYINSDVAYATLCWLNVTNPDVTDVLFADRRAVLTSWSGGILRISGLSDGELVEFFSVNGVKLGEAKACGDYVEFSVDSGEIVLIKIGEESLKVRV